MSRKKEKKENMEVIKKVFLESEDQKVTVFHIVPDLHRQFEAKCLLEKTVEDYETGMNYNTARFVKQSCEFVIIVVEGLAL